MRIRGRRRRIFGGNLEEARGMQPAGGGYRRPVTFRDGYRFGLEAEKPTVNRTRSRSLREGWHSYRNVQESLALGCSCTILYGTLKDWKDGPGIGRLKLVTTLCLLDWRVGKLSIFTLGLGRESLGICLL